MTNHGLLFMQASTIQKVMKDSLSVLESENSMNADCRHILWPSLQIHRLHLILKPEGCVNIARSEQVYFACKRLLL